MARGKAWYYPDIAWHNYGVKYDFSPWSVAGEDIAIPQGTPITAIFAGSVVAHYYDGGGGQVVIKIDNISLSRGIGYYFYAHMDAMDPSLRVGAHVAEGQFLGYSGGQLTRGGPAYPPGYEHHPNDVLHSTGPHILYGLSYTPYINASLITPELEPYWLLDYARAINLPWNVGPGRDSAPSGRVSSITASTPDRERPSLKIAPDAQIGDILGTLDNALYLVNPFDVSAQKKGGSIAGVGFEITSPVDWLTQFGTNIFTDATATTLRVILIIVGFWIVYSALDPLLGLSGIAKQGVGATMGNVGRLAARAIL